MAAKFEEKFQKQEEISKELEKKLRKSRRKEKVNAFLAGAGGAAAVGLGVLYFTK